MSEPTAEAIEAAAFIRYQQDHWGQPTAWPTREELGEGKAIFDDAVTLDQLKADYIKEATDILTAAYPFMVREAQATALEDAAKEFESKAKNIQNNAHIENPEFSLWLGWADTYERAARNLNDRAAAIRDGQL